MTLSGGMGGVDYHQVAVLAGIGFTLLVSIVFLMKAVLARRQERLDRRLLLFASGGSDRTAEKDPPAIRLDFEKLEKAAPDPQGKHRLRTYFEGAARQQRLYRRFIRAGLDPKRLERPFKILRIACFAFGALVAAALLERQMPGGGVYPVGALLIIIAGAGAAFIPHLLLKMRIRRRQQRIEQAVPDMIDLMILCIEAGLTLEVAIARAIDGLKPFAPEVAEEMRLTLNELRILPDKSMALDNLEKRTASRSLKYLVLSLRQSERYGTSISGALKAVAAEMRKTTLLELENAAARMPALLSVPLILLILPPVVALSAGPGFVLMMRAIGG